MSEYGSKEIFTDIKRDAKKKAEEMNLSKLRRKRVIIPTILGILATLIVICVVYTVTYYPADESVYALLQEQPGSNVTITESEDRIVFAPEEPVAGLIFYPGARVQCESYVPLMKELSDEGILCVLIKMPVNLALFGVNKADGVFDDFPGIDHWYIGGHSLGGAMASKYVSEHLDEYEGLILLGAYSMVDLSGANIKADTIVNESTAVTGEKVVLSSYTNEHLKDFKVLSIYGTQDGVLNRSNYDKAASLLPEGSYEVIIDGGNHAYFGNYGRQLRDGNPTITREEQTEWTVMHITEFINRRF